MIMSNQLQTCALSAATGTNKSQRFARRYLNTQLVQNLNTVAINHCTHQQQDDKTKSRMFHRAFKSKFINSIINLRQLYNKNIENKILVKTIKNQLHRCILCLCENQHLSIWAARICKINFFQLNVSLDFRFRESSASIGFFLVFVILNHLVKPGSRLLRLKHSVSIYCRALTS